MRLVISFRKIQVSFPVPGTSHSYARHIKQFLEEFQISNRPTATRVIRIWSTISGGLAYRYQYFFFAQPHSNVYLF